MSFSQMLEILRGENKGKIVFINAGAFFIAIEEDAVLLNSKLKLKCSCFRKNTCKVGVPINSIERYLEKIEKSKYMDRIVHRWYVNSFMEKYFENINKDILYKILERKIKDENVVWLTKEIIYSNEGKVGLPIGKAI